MNASHLRSDASATAGGWPASPEQSTTSKPWEPNPVGGGRRVAPDHTRDIRIPPQVTTPGQQTYRSRHRRALASPASRLPLFQYQAVPTPPTDPRKSSRGLGIQPVGRPRFVLRHANGVIAFSITSAAIGSAIHACPPRRPSWPLLFRPGGGSGRRGAAPIRCRPRRNTIPRWSIPPAGSTACELSHL